MSKSLDNKIQISVDYARYYHGNLILYRPLLLFFDITGIRIIQLIIFITLFVTLTYLLYKQLGKIIMFAIGLPLVIFGYFYISYSLQQAPAYMVMMIYSILVASKLDKWSWNKMTYSSMIVGSLTCFFDFLTTPILTLVLPLIIYVLYYCKEKTIKNNELFFKVLFVSISWGCGFVLTWISKWIICDIVLGTNIFYNAMLQIWFRSYGTNLRISDYAPLLIANCLRCFIMCVFCIFLVYIFTNFKNQLNLFHINIHNKLIIAFIGLMPIFWFIITFNHSIKHAHFTYRNFMLIIVLILLLFFEKRKT